MDWFYFTIVGVVAVELVLLYLCYKFFFSQMNANAWEKKVTQDDGVWLLEILAPVIDETCSRILDTAPKELTKVLKGELLASQGSLSRAVLSDQGEPADMMIGVSSAILEQLGYRNPSPLLATKLASILGGIVGKLNDSETEPAKAQPHTQMYDSVDEMAPYY